MLMLSELLQFRVVEPRGGAGTLDLVVSGLDKDYPVITHHIHRRNNQAEGALSWDKVKVIHQARREVILKESQAQEVESLRQAVWLRWDVLDALVIDLQNRRVTRANDLCLEEKNKHLQLAAADTGPQAILRRLTRGWYRGRSRCNPLV